MATRPAARGARPVRAPCGPPASLAAASVVSRAPQPAPGRAGARGRAAASGAAGAWAPWERAAGRPRGGRSPGVLTPPQAPHGRGVRGVTALGDPERWLPTGNEHGPRPRAAGSSGCPWTRTLGTGGEQSARLGSPGRALDGVIGRQPVRISEMLAE